MKVYGYKVRGSSSAVFIYGSLSKGVNSYRKEFAAKTYRIPSVIRQKFFVLGRVKLVLQQNFVGLI